jgi:hypothetical protein
MLSTAPMAVLSEELGDAVAALAPASRAFDAEHMQLTSDVTEGEEGFGTWLHFTAFDLGSK